MKNAGIIGVGTYIPEKIMTNFDFEKIVETTDEWIRTRTGVEERRFASLEQATSDLGIKAAEKALINANIKIEDIDMILVATCTPDFQIPSTACIIQKKMGAIKAGALDINAACSGFVYGLTLANALIKSNTYKNVLVIGAETLSKITNMEDRNTCILFGDGAAAAVVSQVESNYGVLSTYLGADGDLEEALMIKAGGTRNPITEERIKNKEHFLSMKGQEVFKFAVKALPNATLEALNLAKISPEDVSFVIPHQANVRIIDVASKKIGIPIEKFYMNLNKLGNTSAASIGLALGEVLEKGLIKKGDNVVLTGFGAGLTYGALVMKWVY
ncbi:MAG: beta-ketoacyl-ACP synthase III [Fusobacteriaceae bacterium]